MYGYVVVHDFLQVDDVIIAILRSFFEVRAKCRSIRYILIMDSNSAHQATSRCMGLVPRSGSLFSVLLCNFYKTLEMCPACPGLGCNSNFYSRLIPP